MLEDSISSSLGLEHFPDMFPHILPLNAGTVHRNLEVFGHRGAALLLLLGGHILGKVCLQILLHLPNLTHRVKPNHLLMHEGNDDVELVNFLVQVQQGSAEVLLLLGQFPGLLCRQRWLSDLLHHNGQPRPLPLNALSV